MVAGLLNSNIRKKKKYKAKLQILHITEFMITAGYQIAIQLLFSYLCVDYYVLNPFLVLWMFRFFSLD